jgi:pyrroline-5-carboxylate reductase
VKKRIAIIGCGKMGEAILRGLISKVHIRKTSIFVSDKSASRLKAIKNKYGVNIRRSNIDACAMGDIVILAVKPQDMELVLTQSSDLIESKLVVSIAAGKTLAFIKQKSGALRIARSMPNIPALVGCAMTALSYSKGMSKSDRQETEKIFNCIGKTIVLDEKYLDAVTAVSGSGPAYLFLLMEAMAKAALSMGLNKEVVFNLVKQTIFGSSVLQKELDKCPAALREDVTSKGGTTEAALKVFRKKGFDRIVQQAMTAAFKKSKGFK